MPRIYRSPSGNPDRKYPPRRYVPGTGLPDIPPAVLQRHGGRALRPGDTAMIVDERPPQSTAYRAGVLLIPERAIRDQPQFEAMRAALRPVNLDLVRPDLPDRRAAQPRERTEHLADLRHPVVVRPLAGSPPVVVNAW